MLDLSNALALLNQAGWRSPVGAGVGEWSWVQAIVDGLCDLSSRDSLTGLANRRQFETALAREIDRVARVGEPSLLLMADIDHFKAINDQRGHGCGDYCLREIAKLIGEQLVDDDVFGRYGGEEFLVVLPGRQTEMARAIAEQIRLAIETADLRYKDQSLQLTVSIGVASQLAHEPQPGPAVERADKALYAAKRAGRNRVSVAPAVFAPRSATA